MATISAIVRDVDDLTAEMLEIDENLSRYELNPYDEAVFLARRKEIWLGINPETGHGKAKKKDDNLSSFPGSFAAATARKLGVNVRTVERRVLRSQGLQPDVHKRVRGTWIATRGAYLDAIIKLEPKDQIAVVDLLLSPANEDRRFTVTSAVQAVRGVPEARREEAAKGFQELVRIWKRTSLEDQMRFRKWLERQPAVRLEAVS
jgi:ParB-like chromosome segregation protein Spo0J